MKAGKMIEKFVDKPCIQLLGDTGWNGSGQSRLKKLTICKISNCMKKDIARELIYITYQI
jgi:hypothetical protein